MKISKSAKIGRLKIYKKVFKKICKTLDKCNTKQASKKELEESLRLVWKNWVDILLNN